MYPFEGNSQTLSTPSSGRGWSEQLQGEAGVILGVEYFAKNRTLATRPKIGSIPGLDQQ